MKFRDREDAGRILATMLKERINQASFSLLAIPNGGIPVGLMIREQFSQQCSFGLLFIRKLQIPYNPEAGFGAVTLGGKLFLNRSLLSRLKLTEPEIKRSKQLAMQSLRIRAEKFSASPDTESSVTGHTVVIVDDGLASGFTMLAAVQSIEKAALRTIVAVPTASENAVRLIKSKTQAEVLCPDIRSGSLFAVANAYHYWRDIPDDEAIEAIQVTTSKQQDTSL
jgi:predicted phosphoribosyltransferase